MFTKAAIIRPQNNIELMFSSKITIGILGNNSGQVFVTLIIPTNNSRWAFAKIALVIPMNNSGQAFAEIALVMPTNNSGQVFTETALVIPAKDSGQTR